MNELIEELKRIHEHFKEIRSSPEKLKQFEKDIIECGYGKIKPGPLAMDDVITEEDMWIYRVSPNKPTMVININSGKNITSKTITIIHNITKDEEEYVPLNTDELTKCHILHSDYSININENRSKNTMWRQDDEYTALCS